MILTKPLAPLRTERLVLRAWEDGDLDAYAALNADPAVMEHFPSVLTRQESDASAARIRAAMDAQGWGLWAVEVPAAPDAKFIGFVGLMAPTFEAHFTPCVEVGWRLARAHWGKGYATEGARAALDVAFGPMGLEAVVSMTTTRNARSQHVMEKLGMRRDPNDDFDHPRVPDGSPAKRHVLYRIAARDWQRLRG